MCASSPHCRLGYRSIEQGAETSIQPSEPVILHRQLHTVTCTHTESSQEWVTQQKTGTQTCTQAALIHTCPSDLPIPLYRGGLALSSSCSWVLTYSVGKVIQISIPPAMPPERGGEERNTAVRMCWITVFLCLWAQEKLYFSIIKNMIWINGRVVLMLDDSWHISVV